MIRLSSQNRYRHGVGAALETLEKYQGLPLIRGRWIVVDPYATARDYINGDVYPNIESAYDECVSGRGDGIAVMSGGLTAANTTSYLSHPITWSKWGITVVGVCAPTQFSQRARIANVERTTGAITTIAFPTATTITDSASGFLTAGFAVGDVLSIDTTQNTNDGTTAIITAVTAGTITCAASTFTIQTAATAGSTTIKSWCANLITVSGSNNAFYNLSFYNGGFIGAGCISVTGQRNYFENVHMMGGMGMTTPTITDYDLYLNGGEENTFVNCVFGNDTFDKSDIAGAEVLVGSGAMRNRFIGCEFISYRTAGTTAAMIKLVGAGDSITRTMLFDNCFFHMYRDGNVTSEAALVIGTAPNNGFIVFKSCVRHGFTDWGAVALTARVYSASLTSHESGGLTLAANPS